MAVTPVNLARVSFNQRVFNLREAMRTNQAGLYRVQQGLTTGLRFLQPSEDPLRAASAAALERRLERMDRVSQNVDAVNAVLTEAEIAGQEAVDLISEARAMAIQVISDGTTSAEREALTVVVDALLDRMINVGNRQHLNTYLFSGHQDEPPFSMRYGGVYYSGDGNRMETIVEEDFMTDSFTIPGMEFFGATSSEVRGVVDLNPALSVDTPISALRGALGRGVELGRIFVTADDEQVEIDLSSAATVGDVLDRLNADLPADMSAVLGPNSITIRQGAGREITIGDIGGGRTAIDLGLSSTFVAAERVGPDLDPRITALTTVKDLQAGAGIDLSQSFVIRNGTYSAVIDVSDAETVEDILNAINDADVGVWAKISADDRSIDVISRVSGVDLHIEENDGLTATRLGIRSLHAGTEVSTLNDGQGLRTLAGNDLRIQTASGFSVDVNLDGVVTVQNVLDRLNAAGAGAFTAKLASRGNGIVITDLTAGPGTLTLSALNNSPALQDLGLNVSTTGNQVVGRDVNGLVADNPFTALLELRTGMISDDRNMLVQAGQRLERVLATMQQEQGEMAAQAQKMDERGERLATELSATQILLSDIRDVDFTDATIQYQQLQTALQANLTTASQVLKLSLLDYLR